MMNNVPRGTMVKIMNKIHMMHRSKIAPLIKKNRLKREVFKAYMYPLRFIREMWRWIKLPFLFVALIYRVITGKQRVIWDG